MTGERRSGLPDARRNRRPQRRDSHNPRNKNRVPTRSGLAGKVRKGPSMKLANRLRNLTVIATAWTILAVPGCLTQDEVGTVLSNSIRDFFTALFKTGLGNSLTYVF